MKKNTDYGIYDFTAYADEIKANPQACAYYMALQGQKKEELTKKSLSTPQLTYKSVESSKWKYILIEGVGVNGTSVFNTNALLNKNGKVEVNVLGDFIGKNLVDKSSFLGNATLVVDGKKVETKNYQIDSRDAIWDGRYDRVGTVEFSYDCSSAKKIQIISDVDLEIRSNGLGNIIVDYSPTDLEVK